jgi:hypothetical protein
MKNGIVSEFSPETHVLNRIIWTVKAKENWAKVAQILGGLKAKWFTIGNEDLMIMRENRKRIAKSFITMIAKIQPLPPSTLSHIGTNWVSDGSMIPAVSGIGDDKSVTTALTGPVTLVLCVLRQKNTLYTDHLNSTCFIQDARTRITRN